MEDVEVSLLDGYYCEETENNNIVQVWTEKDGVRVDLFRLFVLTEEQFDKLKKCP